MEIESSDVDMKETSNKRESRRRERKQKNNSDIQGRESSGISSRSNSESSKKRERNNDEEKFKLPNPIKESDRERSLRRALEKMKEKGNKEALEIQAKDKRIEELEREQEQLRQQQQRQRTESRDRATQSSEEFPQGVNPQEETKKKYMEENEGEALIIQLEEPYPDKGAKHYMQKGIHPELKPWHPK